MTKSVLVTGIGGVVGQGILRNIRESDPAIRIVGVNVLFINAGNVYCDQVYEVPYAWKDNYISEMKRIAAEEKIDLILPSTDYESYYLAKYREEFSCRIAAPDSRITFFCLDKYLNYQTFHPLNIPFAQSCLPSAYKGQFSHCVVKPREGRGSRDININPAYPGKFDDTYVVQEFLEGPEITTTFYVRKDGQLHGLITFLRELEQGNTVKCEVTFDYDNEMKRIVMKMLDAFDFRGSFNIQSKVTDHGIIPFEINCRISGTNSVRSQFGFKDIEYLLHEYLYNREPPPPAVTKGAALRIMMDLIFPDSSLAEIQNRQSKFYLH